jgi:hypothetical protein
LRIAAGALEWILKDFNLAACIEDSCHEALLAAIQEELGAGFEVVYERL